jgi:hypothetical protein
MTVFTNVISNKDALLEYQQLIAFREFQNLEKELAAHYYCYLGKNLPLSSVYVDWLTIKLRPFRKQLSP